MPNLKGHTPRSGRLKEGLVGLGPHLAPLPSLDTEARRGAHREGLRCVVMRRRDDRRHAGVPTSMCGVANEVDVTSVPVQRRPSSRSMASRLPRARQATLGTGEVPPAACFRN